MSERLSPPVPTMLVALVLVAGCGEVRSDGLVLSELPALAVSELSRVGGYDAEGVYALGSARAGALLLDRSRFVVVDGATSRSTSSP